jgi:methylase of polypeptide subunit release factors
MKEELQQSVIPENLKLLSAAQQHQVLMQLEKHEHDKYVTNIVLSETEILKDFVVYPEVLRPESMTSLFLARHLYKESHLYNGKTVVDMGCGSGVQGIVMGIGGARRIILSDISKQAITNTKENIEKFQLLDKASVVQSDLFANIEDMVDVIVFNHPFFPADPIKNKPVSISMLDKGDLIHRFFEEAKKHLNKDGIIVMPYLQLAGETNDPQVQGLAHGLDVEVVVRENIETGLQKGFISICHLNIK